jgi:hypothetical protein
LLTRVFLERLTRNIVICAKNIGTPSKKPGATKRITRPDLAMIVEESGTRDWCLYGDANMSVAIRWKQLKKRRMGHIGYWYS